MGHVRAWSKAAEEQQKMQSLQDTISKCKMLLQQKAEQKERLEQMVGKLLFGTYCVVWGIIGIALFNWVMGM